MMRFQIRHFFLGLIFLLLALSATFAQSADDLAQIDRVFDAWAQALDYDSYEIRSVMDYLFDWSAPAFDLNGYSEYQGLSENRIINTGAGFNMQHQLDITQRQLVAEQIVEYAYDAEIRVVDGVHYVQAQFVDPAMAQIIALPEGWIEVDYPVTLDTYPALYAVDAQWWADAPPLDVAKEPFGLETLKLGILMLVQSVAVEETTLGDISVEAITVTLNKQALIELGFFSVQDDVTQAIFDAVEGAPLAVTFLLNDSDQVVGWGYGFDIDVQDVIIDDAGNTVNWKQQRTYLEEITHINQPLEMVDTPFDDAVETVSENIAPDDLPWWNDRIFYEVFVRSFYDSADDGNGDLQGLITQLDYLNDGDPITTDDLGVTGLWLMPVAQSPSYHGYDVIDYRTIEFDYGTNQNFKELIVEAHERDMVVIVDLVLNHTSSRHQWFSDSVRGEEPYDDWYIWADEPGEPSRQPWIGGDNTWHFREGRYYYGLFWSEMPDLNYRNEEVTAEMYAVTEFWLTEMDVDGFRLDAIRHLFETDGQASNAPETFAWLEDYQAFVKSIKPDALLIGEIYDTTRRVTPYVPEKVDIAFEFDLAAEILRAANTGNASRLGSRFSNIYQQYPTAQMATFLTNHDQNRVMSQLDGNIGAARSAASVLLTLPGVPFIYYGEEIGMMGQKPDERIRTPMQWDAFIETAGFTDGVPWEPVQDDYLDVNVALQFDDPTSLLSHYRNLIHLRNESNALRRGDIQFIESSNDNALTFLRSDGDEHMLVIINMSENPLTDLMLNVESTSLSGTVEAILRIGLYDDLIAPEINTQGGFSDYQPLNIIAPYETIVIQLD